MDYTEHKMVTFVVASLDVWGCGNPTEENQECSRCGEIHGNNFDGYIINDMFKVGEVTVPEACTDEDLWAAICKTDFGKGLASNVHVNDDQRPDMTIEDAETGKPIFQLILVEEGGAR